jgi:hypothetical protein
MKSPLLRRKRLLFLIDEAQERVVKEHILLNTDISTMLKIDDAFNKIRELVDPRTAGKIKR